MGRTLIFLILFGGFVLTFIDVRFYHQVAIHEVWEAKIPLFFLPLGAVATLTAVAGGGWLRRLALMIFIAGAAVGVLGFYEHTHFKPKLVGKVFEMHDNDPNFEPTQGRPTLAPLSIAGLSLVGLVLLFPASRQNPNSTT